MHKQRQSSVHGPSIVAWGFLVVVVMVVDSSGGRRRAKKSRHHLTRLTLSRFPVALGPPIRYVALH